MAARTSSISSTTIEFSYWLIFDDAGGVRMTRTEPSIDRRERAMKCSTKLPRSLWRTPTLTASIEVAAPPNGSHAVKIDLGATADALRSVLGVDVDVRIVEPRQ
jgi:hypothetical protein